MPSGAVFSSGRTRQAALRPANINGQKPADAVGGLGIAVAIGAGGFAVNAASNAAHSKFGR
ncbi:hypothetical protein BJL95_12050 [Methylomonas sp. LWB]|uniref:Uncharacterized protein n=1 Tax=Methylomonas koyamae TaxID=702114 RepID=A0A177NZF9_9GAMM|nr:hypothetical protein A1355_02305 [Methylomonas koyamae]OHX34810.1 hypothetical protein BJL95_12050 [Methylomonas sp. LWB]